VRKITDRNEYKDFENYMIFDVLPETMAKALRLKSGDTVKRLLDKINEHLDGKEWDGVSFKQLVGEWVKLEAD